MQKKALHEQVIVITGASSGIGHATARMAAERGARVTICARSIAPLKSLAEALEREGREVLAVQADVRNMHDLQEVSRETVARFGGYDTWINNAGVSISGELEKVPLDEQRLLFDTNYWGVVHGSLAALPQLKLTRGTLINIGSTLSDRAIPLQGAYSASKHAVKGFTDALRMELEAQGEDVAVTLVKPGAINTPYIQHAANHLAREPVFPPPVYAPEVAAEAILHCAVHAPRDFVVGSGGKLISMMGAFAPRLADYVMERTAFGLQQTHQPAHRNGDHHGLHEPSGEGKESGEAHQPVRSTSIYTSASMHPLKAVLAAAAAGLLITGVARRMTHHS